WTEVSSAASKASLSRNASCAASTCVGTGAAALTVGREKDLLMGRYRSLSGSAPRQRTGEQPALTGRNVRSAAGGGHADRRTQTAPPPHWRRPVLAGRTGMHQ